MKNLLPFICILTFLFRNDAAYGQCNTTISTVVTNVSCYNGTNGTVTATASGGTIPYQYQLAEGRAGAWSGVNVFTGLTAGTYPVSVKDATGCIKTTYVTITQPPAINISYTSTDPTCSGSTNGNISTTTGGGTAPYLYSWTKDGANYAATPNLSNLAAGNYLLTVTDAAGCSFSPIIPSQIRPISLTGFNQDGVADGTNSSAVTSTTGALDVAPGNVFYASGYTNPSGATDSKGLPASGRFTSVSDSANARVYQLAPYTSNNTLQLTSSATTGTLTFASQYKSPYELLYVIGSTGSGTGTVNYTVNFTDATTYTGQLSFRDWYQAGAAADRALGNLGRVSRDNNSAFDALINFNLYEEPINIPTADQSKVINTIDFSWYGSGTAVINLFAATGYTSTNSGIRINDGPTSGVVPSIAIASDASSNQFCNNQSVTFTATPTSGGSSPSYQWQLNGTNVATGATYTNNSLNNNDQVSVIMTAAGGVGCLTTTTATSNVLTMTQTAQAASISIIPGSNNICSGSDVTFTATPVNGGATPSYQWKLNGNNVGTNSPTYTNSSLNNNDQVSAVMTSVIGCASNNPAASNTVTMNVSANVTPTAVITASGRAPNISFTSNTAYTGNSPVYQWYKNGDPISGATGSTYSVSDAVIGDAYSLKLSSDYGCITAPAAMSNFIIVAALLPVKWESFTAQVEKNNDVLLQWKTSFEYMNKQYSVQRTSASGSNFETIGTIAATNLPQGSAYDYTDKAVTSGLYLYRIMQEDMDGKYTYSETKTVRIENPLNAFTIIANPVTNGQLQIRLNSTSNLSFYSSDGKLLFIKQYAPGSHSIDVSRYAKGMYWLKSGSKSEKILIQ